jgi:hypothetical protein
MGLMVGNCISEGLFGNLIMKTRPKLEVAKNLKGKTPRRGVPARVAAGGRDRQRTFTPNAVPLSGADGASALSLPD